MVLIILVCVMEGIATATEAAAIAVTYSLILTVFIYRTMTRQNLVKSLAKASKTTGVILLLIGVSNMLRYQMAYLEIPDAIEEALLGEASHRELAARRLKTRMVLQVHDELVFDLYRPEQEEVMALVEDKMKTAIQLDVPIVVEIGVGKNWLEAH